MKERKGLRFFKSMRFRIMTILIIIGIVPALAVAMAAIINYENRAISIRSESVRKQSEILCNLLVRENYMEDPRSELVSGKLELFANIFNGRILLADRNCRIVKDTYGTDEGKTLISSLAVKCFEGETVYDYNKENGYIELAVPIRSPDVPQPQGTMLAYISVDEINETVRELQQTGILILGIVIAASVILGLLLSRMLVKPLSRITKAIEDVTDGYQNEAISVPDYTETVQITEAFNKMLSRMKVLDDSRQEFVSNVSHELKTPMTSMKVLADSLVGQEGLPEELYQEFLQDITMEIDRENKIITDLLSLVKLDKTASEVTITHENINRLLEDILKRLKPIADQRNVDLILDSFRQVEADVDEVKFTLAITNLVENGIKYNVDEGWVRVSLDADHKDFFVTVADSGMGIPEDEIERIFERFYRVDKSHSREIGGTGLGLSITRSAIAMHHGNIKVASKEGEGTIFTVRIPLSYIPEEVSR